MTTQPPTSLPHTEVAIIGAGPIGLEMAAALKRAGVDYLHFEARQIGYTISWWPRDTFFFSTSERIAIAGEPLQNLTQWRTTGEEYLAYLRAVVEDLDLQVHTYEPVVGIERRQDGFLLTTRPAGGEKQYTCRKVIMAQGDMDAPNRLGIPGEDLPHVSHYFRSPHEYFRTRLLIVGGRNTAVEAALRCWRAGAQVTISYRRDRFNPEAVKHIILPDLEAQIELGTIGFLPNTVPVEITPTHVILESTSPDGPATCLAQPADFVLLATGFVADQTLFKLAGVRLDGPGQAPWFDPETMQTSVPDIYVAGTVAAGTQTKYRLFIENCHQHVGKIMVALTGQWPEKLSTIPARQYELPLNDIQAN